MVESSSVLAEDVALRFSESAPRATLEAVRRRLVMGVVAAAAGNCVRVAYALATTLGASGKDAGRFEPVEGSGWVVLLEVEG